MNEITSLKSHQMIVPQVVTNLKIRIRFATQGLSVSERPLQQHDPRGPAAHRARRDLQVRREGTPHGRTAPRSPQD